MICAPTPPARVSAAQYLSEQNASAAEQRQAALRQVMLDFQRFEGDTGSSEVQGERLIPITSRSETCPLSCAAPPHVLTGFWCSAQRGMKPREPVSSSPPEGAAR